jgi:hypothetical protein
MRTRISRDISWIFLVASTHNTPSIALRVWLLFVINVGSVSSFCAALTQRLSPLQFPTIYLCMYACMDALACICNWVKYSCSCSTFKFGCIFCPCLVWIVCLRGIYLGVRHTWVADNEHLCGPICLTPIPIRLLSTTGSYKTRGSTWPNRKWNFCMRVCRTCPGAGCSLAAHWCIPLL